ncbi:MAG: hypothetical protein QG665_181 [Patescibacteria group bacterium]|nr:hypothetical protein [Patescibacteria group bacterium]
MTDQNSPKINITEAIIKKINSTDIKTRSRLFFILKGGAYSTGALFLLLFSLYAVSLVSFVLRANGLLEAPGLGWWGLGFFVHSLPWLLVLLAVIGIVVLEVVVGHFRFAYRRPALYSLLGVIVFIVLGGVVAEKLEMHDRLYRRATEDRLPIFAPIYREYGMMPMTDNYRGKIEKLESFGFWLIESKSGDNYKVLVDNGTKILLPPGEVLVAGERVIVFGRSDDEIIKARAVLMPPDNLPDWPRQRMMKVK